jgi:hypothetical protein
VLEYFQDWRNFIVHLRETKPQRVKGTLMRVSIIDNVATGQSYMVTTGPAFQADPWLIHSSPSPLDWQPLNANPGVWVFPDFPDESQPSPAKTEVGVFEGLQGYLLRLRKLVDEFETLL